MVCTFFGHRDTPASVMPLLLDTLERLIEDCGVDEFYVGCNGNFDRMAVRALSRMQRKYGGITFAVVQSRLPAAQDGLLPSEWNDYPTILPEAVEVGPPRFAIDRRNRWLLDRADCVVTYVQCSAGGAAKFKALAERRGKPVLNLADPAGLIFPGRS